MLQLDLGVTLKIMIVLMAAILKFWVTVMSQCKSDVRIRILVVNSSRKVCQNMVLGALVQKLIFQDGG